jgi:hypothetical protein
VMFQIVASLTDDSKGVIYDCNTFYNCRPQFCLAY